MLEISPYLQTEELKLIMSSTDFYFQKGQDALQRFLAIELEESFKEKLITLSKNYDAIQAEALIDPALREVLEMMFEVIAYCDSKGKDKNVYNTYSDKRTVAKAGVYMGPWIRNLVLFKYEPDQLPAGSTRNAFKYLLDPLQEITVLSEGHRRLIVKNLFGGDYISEIFVADAKAWFAEYDLVVLNPENYTHLLSRILYLLSGHWLEGVIGLMASDGTKWQENYVEKIKEYDGCILWNSKRPSGGNETLKFLSNIIKEEGTFYLYYASGGKVMYRAEIIDFARDQQELDQKQWHKEKNIMHYSKSFSDYNLVSKKARIVFLADSIEKVDAVPVSSFSFYANYKLPTQDNLSPIKKEPNNVPVLEPALQPARKEATMTDAPLNQILYGPPGTGKTYHTINKALAIIEGKKEEEYLLEERKDLRKRFDHYLSKGQIVFTTFHQSMSYEDFIEGIKPKTISDKVTYEVEPGIFKRICDKASRASGNFATVIEQFKRDILEGERKENLTIKSKDTTFDIVYRGTNTFHIQPHNTTKSDPWYPINIDQLQQAFETDSFEKTYNVTYLRETINYLKEHYRLRKEAKLKTEEVSQDRYVLIIDEINRGNVSQIFGELITLIEPSKRLENDEALEVTLPYSKTIFGVPNNLYIIGTMNTADRSVEALDTALRRRFCFEEMPPRPELLSPGYRFWDLLWVNKKVNWEDKDYSLAEKKLLDFQGASEKIWNERKTTWDQFEKEGKNSNQAGRFMDQEFFGPNLSDLLNIINQRIEVLLDRDHLIGHSFFLGVNSWDDLQQTFAQNIIPLLQEYFYGDYGKIRLVLGNGFVHTKAAVVKFAVADEEYGFEETEIFSVVHRAKDAEAFKLAFYGISPMLKAKNELTAAD